MAGLTRMVIIVCALVLGVQAGVGKHHKKPHAAATKALQPKHALVNASSPTSLLETLEMQLEADVAELVGDGFPRNFEEWREYEFPRQIYRSRGVDFEEVQDVNNPPTSFVLLLDMGSSGTKTSVAANQECTLNGVRTAYKSAPNIADVAGWPIAGSADGNNYIAQGIGRADAARAAAHNVLAGAPAPLRQAPADFQGIVGGGTAGGRIRDPNMDLVIGGHRFLPRAQNMVPTSHATTNAGMVGGAQTIMQLATATPGGHTLAGTHEAFWEYQETLFRRRNVDPNFEPRLPNIPFPALDGNFISMGGASFQVGILVTLDNVDAIITFLNSAEVANHPSFPTNPAGAAGHGARVVPPGPNGEPPVNDFVAVSRRNTYDLIEVQDILSNGNDACVLEMPGNMRAMGADPCILLLSWLMADTHDTANGNAGMHIGTPGGPGIHGSPANPGQWDAAVAAHRQYFNIGGVDEASRLFVSRRPGWGGANGVAPAAYPAPSAPIIASLVAFGRTNAIVQALDASGVLAASRHPTVQNNWVMYGNVANGACGRAQRCSVARSYPNGWDGTMRHHMDFFHVWTQVLPEIFGLDHGTAATWNGGGPNGITPPFEPVPVPGVVAADPVNTGNDFVYHDVLTQTEWSYAVGRASLHPHICENVFP